MNNINNVLGDLEVVMSDIVCSGLRNIEYNLIEKMKKLKEKMEVLAMKEGSICIESFCNAVIEYKTSLNNSEYFENTVKTFACLQFYLENALANN